MNQFREKSRSNRQWDRQTDGHEFIEPSSRGGGPKRKTFCIITHTQLRIHTYTHTHIRRVRKEFAEHMTDLVATKRCCVQFFHDKIANFSQILYFPSLTPSLEFSYNLREISTSFSFMSEILRNYEVSMVNSRNTFHSCIFVFVLIW